MPELPEVETIVRGLRSLLVGRSIRAAAILWPRTLAQPAADEFALGIAGRRILSLARRGKYVIAGLDAGCLLIHLKMSGRLRIAQPGEPLGPHTRAWLELDDGRQLRFEDARKFGRIYLVQEPAQVTANLGPEPLGEGFSLDEFRRRLAGRTARLKSLLLNQQFIAGVGNIYADEILFRARLHPLRTAASLTPDEQEALYYSTRQVLQGAVAGRGTTLDDRGYVDAWGQPGGYQHEISVYGREGELCPRCGAAIERIVIGQRSAHYCPVCQPWSCVEGEGTESQLRSPLAPGETGRVARSGAGSRPGSSDGG